jgi:hypothetical protein
MKYHVIFGGIDTPDSVGTEPAWEVGGYFMPATLMSKYPILEYTLFNANRNDGYTDPSSPLQLFRGSLLAKIAIPPSDTVYVVVVHLNPWHNDTMNNFRLEEIKGILKLVAPLKRFPILLIGDFNALSPKDGATGTEALTIAYLENQEYRDAYRFLHPNPVLDSGLPTIWPCSLNCNLL